MNGGDLSIKLRSRRNLEALDLGFAIGRRYFKELWKVGLIYFLPVWGLLLILFWKYPWVALLLIWGTKPLLDRFYLYVVSRRVFGETVQLTTMLREWKALLWRGGWTLLLIKRGSPHRSLTLPIRVLEGLRGRAYAKRAETIKREGGGTALLKTIFFLLLEGLFLLSLTIGLSLFIPQGTERLFGENGYVWSSDGREILRVMSRVICVLYAVVVLALEPFYITTGFALYLNSRTKQELWDVELQFRQMGERLKKQARPSAPLALVGMSLLLGRILAPTPALAQEQEPSAQQTIEEVLSGAEFQPVIKERKQWVPGELDFDWLASFFEAFASDSSVPLDLSGVTRLLGILMLVVLVIVLLYFMRRFFAVPERLGSQKRRSIAVKRGILSNSEPKREPLPSDITASAQRLWQEGQPKRALSLLYRGALYSLAKDFKVEIAAHFTERECLQATTQGASASLARYFEGLSTQWTRTAYYEQTPCESEFLTLCRTWPF